MSDSTEGIRRLQQATINAAAAERYRLEARYGTVWDTAELSRDFTVEGFAAPYVMVTRKTDDARGSLVFQHRPRYYWGFQPDGG